MSLESVLDPILHCAPGLSGALRDRGFACGERGWSRGGLLLARRGRWLVLNDYESDSAERALTGGMGRPGLWKEVCNGTPPIWLFELPSWAVSEQSDKDPLDDSGPAPVPKLLDWALDLRRDRFPSGWRPPEASLVRSWLGRGGLTVQARGCVRQGELMLARGPLGAAYSDPYPSGAGAA